MTKAVLIAGPTASGKSALAIELAKQLNGEIINADSMQVYQDLEIVTACPTAEEQAEAPHSLYGYLDGDEVCSAARWATDAEATIKAARREGRLPILVGGTGLYFRAILEGLSQMPDIPEDVRMAVRSEVEARGPEALHADLQAVDPETADRLAPLDQQRISRALEVYRASGTPISVFQKQVDPGFLDGDDKAGEVIKLVLEWPREQLYARCDMRFDQMIEAGALTEVGTLMQRELPLDRPVMRALGVPELISVLTHTRTLEEARLEAQMQTRRFAKRQMTWFRNQTPDWSRIDAQDWKTEIIKIVQKIH